MKTTIETPTGATSLFRKSDVTTAAAVNTNISDVKTHRPPTDVMVIT